MVRSPWLQSSRDQDLLARCGLAERTPWTCADGRDVVISIQNDRERAAFCRELLRDPALIADPRSNNNAARCDNRAWVDAKVGGVFGKLTSADVIDRLTAAATAYGSVNDLIEHPQLRTMNSHRERLE